MSDERKFVSVHVRNDWQCTLLFSVSTLETEVINAACIRKEGYPQAKLLNNLDTKSAKHHANTVNKGYH